MRRNQDVFLFLDISYNIEKQTAFCHFRRYQRHLGVAGSVGGLQFGLKPDPVSRELHIHESLFAHLENGNNVTRHKNNVHEPPSM